MFDILKYPRKRYIPGPGCLYYLPLNKMSVGVSPNIMDWSSTAPDTVWSVGARATKSSVDTPTPPISAKCLKCVANDAGGAGAGIVEQNLATVSKYLGVTMTYKAYCQCPDTNDKNNYIYVWDGVASGTASNISKDNAWGLYSTTRKIATNASTLKPSIRVKDTSAADTDDIVYLDAPMLTVPQMLDLSPYANICHPEGAVHVANGFSFDGSDDLITLENDRVGTGACTIMAWVRLTSLATANKFILSNGQYFFLVTTLGVLGFTSDQGSTYCNSSAAAIAINTWYHIAFTRTAAGIGNMYINGALSGNPDQHTDADDTISAGSSNTIVGNRIAGDRPFAGSIDELVIYNRICARSEIVEHMLLTRGGK